jgi:hypothetical protein
VHNVLKSSFPFQIPGQTVLQQLQNIAGGRQLHNEKRHYVCYSRNGNRITEEKLGGHLAQKKIIRGATALTNLGRLSSRRWQSFRTAPDGTGLTCG